ncbi:MAG: hypothetical protein CMI52_01885 [Parcubacteria group bacterium]|nr:hypothetical protein [Parcubacteria group bacterium]
MIESSKDILYVVLAFAALWVAIFLCWTLYYVGRLIKNANEVMEEVREYGGRLDEAVRSIRDRMESVAGGMSVVATGITKVVGKAIEKRFVDEDEKPKKKTKKK